MSESTSNSVSKIRFLLILLTVILSWLSVIGCEIQRTEFYSGWPDYEDYWLFLPCMAFAILFPILFAHITIRIQFYIFGLITWLLLAWCLSLGGQLFCLFTPLRNQVPLLGADSMIWNLFIGYWGSLVAQLVFSCFFKNWDNYGSDDESTTERLYFRFSIASAVTWMTLVAVLLFLNSFFQEQIFSDSEDFWVTTISAFVVYFCITLAAYCPATMRMTRARMIWPSYLSWTICTSLFLAVASGFWVEWELVSEDLNFIERFWYALVFTLPLCWLIVVCFGRFLISRGANRETEFFYTVSQKCSGVTAAITVTVVLFWLAIHFGVHSRNRSVESVLYSEPLNRMIAEAIVPEQKNQDVNALDHESTIKFMDRLLSKNISKTQNAFHQILGMSKLYYLDRETVDVLQIRKLMGFKESTVLNLKDRDIRTWLDQKRPDFINEDDDYWEPAAGLDRVFDFKNHANNSDYVYAITSVPWQAEELPLAGEFVHANQSLFEQLRSFSKLPGAFLPGDDKPSDNITTYVGIHLELDAYYQFHLGNFDRVIDNIEALLNYSRLIENNYAVQFHGTSKMTREYRVPAFRLCFYLLNDERCRKSDVKRIRQLDLSTNFGKRIKSKLFGQVIVNDWITNDNEIGMLEYTDHPLRFLVRYFPFVVDWQEFKRRQAEIANRQIKLIFERLEVMNGSREFRAEVSELDPKHRVEELKMVQCTQALILGPKAKANLLASTSMELLFSSVENDLRFLAMERLFEVSLFLYLYQKDMGRLPASLRDLTPKYLSRIPLDPIDGSAPIYAVLANGGFELRWAFESATGTDLDTRWNGKRLKNFRQYVESYR